MLTIAGLGLASAPARGEFLYSVAKGGADALVRIDSNTGLVTTILTFGPSDHIASLTRMDEVDLAIDADLAMTGSATTLYLLNSIPGVDIEILTIDLTAPAVTSVQPVRLGGSIPNINTTPSYPLYNCGGDRGHYFAEGLAWAGGRLVIGFPMFTDDSPSNCASLSNMIGFLEPTTGAITQEYDLFNLKDASSPNCFDCPFGNVCTPDLACRADIDGMTGFASGRILMVDGINDGRWNDPQRTEFVDVVWPNTPTFTEKVPGGVFRNTNAGVNDVERSCNPDLFYGIGQASGQPALIAFDLTNGNPTITPLQAGDFRGLALGGGFDGLGALQGRILNDLGNGLAGWTVTAVGPGPPPVTRTTTTNANGEYTLAVPAGVYTITQTIQDPSIWTQRIPVSPPSGHSKTVAACGKVSGINFVNHAAANVVDLAISVAGGQAVVGKHKTYGVRVVNNGTVTRGHTPTLTLDVSKVTYVASDQGGTFSSPTVTWPFVFINPGAAVWYRAVVDVPLDPVRCPPPPACPSTGIDVCATASVDLDLLPDDPVNPILQVNKDNRDEDCEPIRCCPVDPNVKLVSPEGIIQKTGGLKYQIHFQNTGDAPAVNVVVRDMLDPNLDLSSVSSGASSAPYTFAVNGSELVWTFANINLPDSTTDEPGSHGFVTFKVRPRADVSDCASIKNSAAIFFDFNDPVITDQVRNTIQCPTIPATIDVNPNAVNLSSNGRFVTVYVELPSGMQPTSIDVATVRLAGSLPADLKFAHVGDYDGDGIPDLMLKFSRQALYPLLTDGDNELEVSGQLTSGEAFSGTDVVRVINHGSGHPTAFVAPNPLNPSGVLAFSTAKPGHVSVRMFDLHGHLVRTLMETPLLPAGLHEVNIDSQDQRGEGLPSGVYFYRIESVDGTIRGRFVILK